MAYKILWGCPQIPPDEGALLRAFRAFSIEIASSCFETVEQLKVSSYDAVIMDCHSEDGSPEDLLDAIHRVSPGVPVILQSAAFTLADAVRLTRLGVWQVMNDKADLETLAAELESFLDHVLSNTPRTPAGERGVEPWRTLLLGESHVIEKIAGLIRLVGPRRSTVLLSGETGTGKEVVARAIHMASPRSSLPMVSVNCAALPENLLEAELFGHVKGAFTGAVQNRIGRFQQAHNSSLFLDEVGDLPLSIQTKLLRVLQERQFERLGSSETVRVDVRVIAASNRNLEDAVKQGSFREDLFYRLNVVPIHIAPLRERLSDIPILVPSFIEKICRQEQIPLKMTTRETLDRLCRHSWPGNVRQLENAVEMAVALSGERRALYPSDFPLPSAPALVREVAGPVPNIDVPDEGLDFEEIVSHMERAILEQALRKTAGNKARAAGMLRLKRTTLAAKLRSLSVGSDELAVAS
jgi:DNA-binding NtrC family response regulator